MVSVSITDSAKENKHTGEIRYLLRARGPIGPLYPLLILCAKTRSGQRNSLQNPSPACYTDIDESKAARAGCSRM